MDENLAKLGLDFDFEPTFFERVQWSLESLLSYPRDIWGHIAAFCQRGKRGYATRDCWGIDWYLDSWLPNALRDMIDPAKHGGNGYPGEPYGKEGNTRKRWFKTVEKIATGFESHRKLSDFEYEGDKEKKKLEQEFKEGMILFVKYYDHLWD